jgi:hypothetical protein
VRRGFTICQPMSNTSEAWCGSLPRRDTPEASTHVAHDQSHLALVAHLCMMAHRGGSTEEGGAAYQESVVGIGHRHHLHTQAEEGGAGAPCAGSFLSTKVTAPLLAAEKAPSTRTMMSSFGRGRTTKRVEGCPWRQLQLWHAAVSPCSTALARMWRGEQLHPL